MTIGVRAPSDSLSGLLTPVMEFSIGTIRPKGASRSG